MDAQDQSSFDKWLQDSYLSPELKQAITESAEAVKVGGEIVGNVMTIVGIFGAFIKIVTYLSFEKDAPDRLQALADIIGRVDTRLTSLAAWNANANWTELLSKLSTASTALRDFLVQTGVGVGSQSGLLSDSDRIRVYDTLIQPTRAVRNALLSPPENGPSNFQESILPIPPSYLFPMSAAKFVPVNPGPLGFSALPAIPAQPWIGDASAGMLIWDYRRALPHVVRMVTQLALCWKMYDPAFRTTHRFKSEIEELIRDLDLFAARWLQCLVWTHDLPLEPPEYQDSDIPESIAPCAIDIRTGAAVSYHPRDNVFHSMPVEPEYSRRRLEFSEKLALYSGLKDFRDWIDRIRELATLPTKTESIEADVQITGARAFVKRASMMGHGPARVVKLHHVDWLVSIALTVQPQIAPYDYAHGRPIVYGFSLETYQDVDSQGEPHTLIERVPLNPGRGQLRALLCNSPEIWVPAEDDGTYGDATHGYPANRHSLMNSSAVAQGAINQMLGNFRHLADTAHFDHVVASRDVETPPPPQEQASNRVLANVARFAHYMSGRNVVTSPPPMTVVNAKRKRVTIGYSLEFGPRGDLREGVVAFSAWTLDGEESNVGSLYLVIEETPPLDPQRRIRTLFGLPLNPTEIWFPAFSRPKWTHTHL